MSIVVVGGHSRSVGKTSVVAGLVAHLRDLNWTAVKITQYGHGICSAHGEPCHCAVNDEEHSWAITEERSYAGDSDTSRFLVAGAVSSIWVRTRQGRLAEAMPRLRQMIEQGGNLIFESNSLLGFLRPDLYLTVLDHATADFKDSARLYLDRADVILLHSDTANLLPKWRDVSERLLAGKRLFPITHRQYVTPELASFVRAAVSNPRGCAMQPALDGR
jgi:hypothetical protein